MADVQCGSGCKKVSEAYQTATRYVLATIHPGPLDNLVDQALLVVASAKWSCWKLALDICQLHPSVHNQVLFECPSLIEHFLANHKKSNVIQLPDIVLQALHAVDASCIAAPGLAYELGIPTTETDIGIALIAVAGLHKDQPKAKLQSAAAYVDLGNYVPAVPLQAMLKPVGIDDMEHTKQPGRCRDPVRGHSSWGRLGHVAKVGSKSFRVGSLEMS